MSSKFSRSPGDTVPTFNTRLHFYTLKVSPRTLLAPPEGSKLRGKRKNTFSVKNSGCVSQLYQL